MVDITLLNGVQGAAHPTSKGNPMKKIFGKISINAPVILGLTGISLIVLIINSLSGGRFNNAMGIYYTSITDLTFYTRFFTHSIAHINMTHYAGNFLLILAIGPLIEEKYGSRYTLIALLICSVVTGLVHVIFQPRVMLLGASGIAFMLILIGSFVNTSRGKIPLTFILVTVLYICNEIIAGITVHDNVSRVTHVIGGICGAACGWYWARRKSN